MIIKGSLDYKKYDKDAIGFLVCNKCNKLVIMCECGKKKKKSNK